MTEGEQGGGRLPAPLKREILAILKSLGTLPLPVRVPGFTPTHWSAGSSQQDEVSCSPPLSSCKSRPEGRAVGSHGWNPAQSAGKWPDFLYRKTRFILVLPKSKDCYSSKGRGFFLLWKHQIPTNLNTQPLKQLNAALCCYSVQSFQKQMCFCKTTCLINWNTAVCRRHCSGFQLSGT